jgi:hypothetical protein
MKTNSILFVSLLILSGCNWGTSSVSSSPSLSSSIPIPNNDFLPYLNGKKFLVHQTKTFTYGTTSVSDLSEMFLSKVNYPTNEDFLTPYAVNGAVVGQFNNQTITFDSTQQPDARDTLASMTVGEVSSEVETIALLNQLTRSDEVFNQKTIVLKERNLSNAFFESDYYWFNHYVLEETMTIQRYPNQILYGTGQQVKTFQTEVSIPVGVQYQVYADDKMIYDIRDETYPSGFFGARDLKFETIRTQDNLKKALTLGPATEMIGFWNLFKQGSLPMGVSLQEPLTTYQISIEMKKTTADTIMFSLRVYRGEYWVDALESFEFNISLKGQTWQSVNQTYLLWEPSVPG